MTLAPLRLRIRPAIPSDIPVLMDFYQHNASDTLPAPSHASLTGAVNDQSLLIVQNEADQSFAATAGYFQYAKSAKSHCIYELSGTRVTRGGGGIAPIPLQKILLAIRIFQIFVTDGTAGNLVSVISSARHPTSQANLEAVRMVALQALPRWLDYDTYSWIRVSERAQWRHYIAADDAILAAIEILRAVRFGEGAFACDRAGKAADDAAHRQAVSISYALGLVAVFRDVDWDAHRGSMQSAFRGLPQSI